MTLSLAVGLHVPLLWDGMLRLQVPNQLTDLAHQILTLTTTLFCFRLDYIHVFCEQETEIVASGFSKPIILHFEVAFSDDVTVRCHWFVGGSQASMPF